MPEPEPALGFGSRPAGAAVRAGTAGCRLPAPPHLAFLRSGCELLPRLAACSARGGVLVGCAAAGGRVQALLVAGASRVGGTLKWALWSLVSCLPWPRPPRPPPRAAPPAPQSVGAQEKAQHEALDAAGRQRVARNPHHQACQRAACPLRDRSRCPQRSHQASGARSPLPRLSQPARPRPIMEDSRKLYSRCAPARPAWCLSPAEPARPARPRRGASHPRGAPRAWLIGSGQRQPARLTPRAPAPPQGRAVQDLQRDGGQVHAPGRRRGGHQVRSAWPHRCRARRGPGAAAAPPRGAAAALPDPRARSAGRSTSWRTPRATCTTTTGGAPGPRARPPSPSTPGTWTSSSQVRRAPGPLAGLRPAALPRGRAGARRLQLPGPSPPVPRRCSLPVVPEGGAGCC
jgi:hypothetical protein